jgi:hypothetical protein
VVGLIGVGMAEFTHCGVQSRAEWAAQRLVGPRLELPGAPAIPYCGGPQGVEENRLADSAQAGEDQRSLWAAGGYPLQDDVERLELGVASGELGRALPGTGGVGVPDGIHA